MRKLKLELEMLAVESFDTSPAARGAAGTVRGLQYDDAQAGHEAEAIDIPVSPLCGPTPVTACETCNTNCGSCYSCTPTACGYTCPVQVCDPPPPPPLTYPRCPIGY